MIILRQKTYSIKYNPTTKKYEGKVDWRDRAKSAAVLGTTGAGVGALLGGAVGKPGKGALIGAGIGTGLSTYLTRQSRIDKHNKKIDQENQEREARQKAGKPVFNSSEINKYKNKPELKWLPKEYWKLLDIKLEIEPLMPNFGDGDEYVWLYVKKPWDIEEVYDFDEEICNPYLISLGVQEYDSIGYYSKSKKWFIGYDDYDGLYNGKKQIPNLKQFLIKAFQTDLAFMKKNEFGWEDDEVESVIRYQERALQLLKKI
jgi:hypothetical protein